MAWEKLLNLRMAPTSHLLASGPGWRVDDVVCAAGPHDRPFEEVHDGMCIAAVTHGTFEYRTGQGSAVLAPGALLLGNDRHCFQCGHEHAAGDRCLSFHFTREFLEAVVAGVPEARQAVFSAAHVPPVPALIPVLAAAEAAREDGDAAEFAELALRIAGAAVATLAEAKESRRVRSGHDERRISRALRRIETEAHHQLSLLDLAREAAMSPYHFLRTFRAIVGLTPHQFVLRTRLHRAALRLRASHDPISAIAFDAGFNDLSTFNRRFRRVMGLSPSAYRQAWSFPRRREPMTTSLTKEL
jgi:AraC family transcriptional regulator